MTLAGDCDSDPQFRLLPGALSDPIIQEIIDTWNGLDSSGDLGAADGGAIADLRQEVTEALGETPPDKLKASGLTFKALLLIQSNTDC